MNTNDDEPIHVRHLIGGQWVDTPDHDESVDPYRGEVVARVARGTPDIVERAMAAASAAGPTIAAMPPRVLSSVRGATSCPAPCTTGGLSGEVSPGGSPGTWVKICAAINTTLLNI